MNFFSSLIEFLASFTLGLFTQPTTRLFELLFQPWNGPLAPEEE